MLTYRGSCTLSPNDDKTWRHASPHGRVTYIRNQKTATPETHCAEPAVVIVAPLQLDGVQHSKITHGTDRYKNNKFIHRKLVCVCNILEIINCATTRKVPKQNDQLIPRPEKSRQIFRWQRHDSVPSMALTTN